jgi:hypothetical protein
MKEPQAFLDLLTSKHGYKLKGVGEPKYHLGGDFGRDPDGTLTWGAKSYIKKMIDNYERMFGEPPKKYSSPIDPDATPELDTSDVLDADGISKYMSLIGALQWCVTLGRFDIAVGVMSLSRFRCEPRTGHLQHIKRMYGYLRKHPDAAIRFRTGIPNNEAHFSMPEYDWMHSVYGDSSEEIPEYLPEP